MGTDNLFHKRKAKKLARQKANRKPYDKVLIVCEGEKTEPNYFKELKDYCKLDSATITGDCGSSPMNVVDYAWDIYCEAEKAGDAFDRVFCVFDKDAHGDYQAAIDKLTRMRPRKVFEAITSVPCFEYWLLLHFDYTDRPFHATGKNSIAGMVLQELKQKWPEYEKAVHGAFEQRLRQLEYAKTNAARALKTAQANGTDNPCTQIHELVDYLQNLKNKLKK
ncbi:hypothetical protein MNBD_GAMMA19-755 [hydrothermal vent metagenome]|uniref:RloB domain-containing protein n=1 Tax=hydrothermal vent metagenome TaxID=652676 RepID=A0A3B1ADK6_9ZZZZ